MTEIELVKLVVLKAAEELVSCLSGVEELSAKDLAFGFGIDPRALAADFDRPLNMLSVLKQLQDEIATAQIPAFVHAQDSYS